jgi:membrane protein required for colicin V production
VLLGILRGGTKEVLSLGGWVGGLVLAFLAAPLVSPLLQDWIASANPRWLAAFVLIYVMVRIVAWGLGKLLTEMIAAAKLGAFDKLIGAVFGVFRAVVITLLVAFLCMMTRMPSTPLWLSSTSAPIIQNVVIALTPFLPADAQRWIQK